MKHELLKTQIPELHFKPEGYLSSSSEEFLEAFLERIRASGFDPDSLVFSGFDGTTITRGEAVPRYPHIFAMNEAGWRNAIEGLEANPAEYAEGWETPCVGLYDKSQLVWLYSYDFQQDSVDFNSKLELSNINLGSPPAELDPEVPVEEAVVHKNYPEDSPTDALVGLVFIDQE